MATWVRTGFSLGVLSSPPTFIIFFSPPPLLCAPLSPALRVFRRGVPWALPSCCPPLPALFLSFFFGPPPSLLSLAFPASRLPWASAPPPFFVFCPAALFLLRVCCGCSGVSCCVFPVLPVRCAVRVVCAVSGGWCCWFLVSLPFVEGLLVALVARRFRLVVCVGSGARVWSGRRWASSLWCPVPLRCVLWRCAAVWCCAVVPCLLFFVFLPARGAGFLLFPVGSGLRAGSGSLLFLCSACAVLCWCACAVALCSVLSCPRGAAWCFVLLPVVFVCLLLGLAVLCCLLVGPGVVSGGLVRVWVGLAWARYFALSLPTVAAAAAAGEVQVARAGSFPRFRGVLGAAAWPAEAVARLAAAAVATPCASSALPSAAAAALCDASGSCAGATPRVAGVPGAAVRAAAWLARAAVSASRAFGAPSRGGAAELAAWVAAAVTSAGLGSWAGGSGPTSTAASASLRSSRSAGVSPVHSGETGERERDQRWWRSSRWGEPSESAITVILVGMRGGRCALHTTSWCSVGGRGGGGGGPAVASAPHGRGPAAIHRHWEGGEGEPRGPRVAPQPPVWAGAQGPGPPRVVGWCRGEPH